MFLAVKALTRLSVSADSSLSLYCSHMQKVPSKFHTMAQLILCFLAVRGVLTNDTCVNVVTPQEADKHIGLLVSHC